MALEAWMYRDPSEIADSLAAKTEAQTQKEKKRREIERKHKRRRIVALTRQAMRHGGNHAK